MSQMNFNNLRDPSTRLDSQLLVRKAYLVGTLEQLCRRRRSFALTL